MEAKCRDVLSTDQTHAQSVSVKPASSSFTKDLAQVQQLNEAVLLMNSFHKYFYNKIF